MNMRLLFPVGISEKFSYKKHCSALHEERRRSAQNIVRLHRDDG